MDVDDGSVQVTVNHKGLAAHYTVRPNDYPVRIGRDPENDIVVENRGVSKFHAELRLPGGHAWPGHVCVVDLSMNGTAIQFPGKDVITCVPRGTEVRVPDGAVFLMPWLLKGPVSSMERAQFTLHYEKSVPSLTDEGEAQSQVADRQVHHASHSLLEHQRQPLALADHPSGRPRASVDQEPEEAVFKHAGKRQRPLEADLASAGAPLRQRTAPCKTTKTTISAVKSDPGSPPATRQVSRNRGRRSSVDRGHLGAAPVGLGLGLGSAVSSTGLLARSRESRPVHDPSKTVPQPLQGRRTDPANGDEQNRVAAKPKRRRVVPKGLRTAANADGGFRSTSRATEEVVKDPPAVRVKLEIPEVTEVKATSVPQAVSQLHHLLPLPPPPRTLGRGRLRRQCEIGKVFARSQLTSSTAIPNTGALSGHEQALALGQPKLSDTQGTSAYPVVLRPRPERPDVHKDPKTGQLCRTEAATSGAGAPAPAPEPVRLALGQPAAVQKVVLVPRTNVQVPPAPPAAPPIFTNVLSEEQAQEFELMMREMM